MYDSPDNEPITPSCALEVDITQDTGTGLNFDITEFSEMLRSVIRESIYTPIAPDLSPIDQRTDDLT